MLGGRTGVGQPLGSVEMYECSDYSETEAWTKGPNLCLPRSALGAGSCGSSVYAVGGQAGRTIYNTMECLDIQRAQWHVLGGQLQMKRKYVAVR